MVKIVMMAIAFLAIEYFLGGKLSASTVACLA